MKRRFLSLLLVLTILFGMIPSTFAAGVFSDVKPGSWYEQSVNYVYENGLMKGTSSTKFEPQTIMSRAMLVTVLHRIAGEPHAWNSDPFTDLKRDSYYADAVAWAYENGVVNGVSATTFCPNDPVSREQMVTIFCRYAAYEGLDCSAYADLSSYADRADVNNYAKDAFSWAVASGIINGTDANHLSPDDNATRAVCATIIQRYVLWSRNKGPEDTRPYYHLGNCKELMGKPYTLVIYMDDNESSWNQNDVSVFWNDLLIPGLDYLEQKASEWNVPLDFQTGYYYTGMEAGVNVRYNGVVASDIMTETPSYDILDQAAVSLGYGTKEAMNRYIQNFSGQEEILYLIIMNKDGRSYSVRDEYDDGSEMLEYCVIYPDYPNYTYETPAATVAHEVLHLFGAEDYYNPYGDTPGRADLAKEICPNDIMLTVYYDLSYNELCNFTAYTVGWTDELSAEFQDPRWWQ